MPVDEHVRPERRLVHSIMSGELRGDELVVAALELRANPRFERSFAQLVDYRAMKTVSATSHQFSDVDALDPFLPSARRVFLVACDLAFGLARKFEQLHAGAHSDIHITWDADEAWALLGVPADDPVRLDGEDLVRALKN